MPSIPLDSFFDSPYDLPRLVEAQDPPVPDDPDLQALLDNPPTVQAPGETTESAPSVVDDAEAAEDATETPGLEVDLEADLIQEIESGPSADWQKYLQPILKDIKNTVRVSIELRNSYMVPYAGDPDLGFYITGDIMFTDAVPLEYQDLPKDELLRYVAYVSPDGVMSKTIDLIYSSKPKTPTPDYSPSNPNVYR